MCLTNKATSGEDTAKSEAKEGRGPGRVALPGSELGGDASDFYSELISCWKKPGAVWDWLQVGQDERSEFWPGSTTNEMLPVGSWLGCPGEGPRGVWGGRILASVLQSSSRQLVVGGLLVFVRSERLVAAAPEDSVTCLTSKLGRQAGSGDGQGLQAGKPPSTLSGARVWTWCGRHWERSRLQETGRVPCDGNPGRTA